MYFYLVNVEQNGMQKKLCGNTHMHNTLKTMTNQRKQVWNSGELCCSMI